jgi:hypothetical protein
MTYEKGWDAATAFLLQGGFYNFRAAPLGLTHYLLISGAASV